MEMLSGEDREAAIYSMQAVRRQVQRAGDKDLPEVVIPWTPGFEGKGAKDAENPSIERSSCRERVTPSEGTPARPEDGHMPHEFPHQRPRRNEQPLPAGEWLTIANDGDFAVQMMVASKHDPVGFKSVVRLDAVDTDAPLSREAFLEKYPIHPSWASAPWASPKTRAMCARWTERYHAHEAEWPTLSLVEQNMILEPELAKSPTRHLLETLPDRLRPVSCIPPRNRG